MRRTGFGRADIGAARQVFLDDVVLHGALQGGDVGALFFGHGDIERQQPGRGGVDRHRGVHLFQRDIREQRAHVAQMRRPARRPCRPRRATGSWSLS